MNFLNMLYTQLNYASKFQIKILASIAKALGIPCMIGIYLVFLADTSVYT
jgi:hypothetical protein